MPRLPSLLVALAAVLVAAASFAQSPPSTPAPVAKTNATTDVTDLWWPDAEPGWGIQLVQNRTVVFATLYVYGPTGAPTFYVATLENPPAGSTGIWTGTVYATTGPWFGGAFNPGTVVETAVGTMTFALTGIGVGTLDYTIGGTSVSKTINRQPLRFEDNTGTYGFVHTWVPTGGGCTAADAYATGEVPPTGVLQIFAVDADTAGVTLQWKLSPVEICQATMQYSQLGRLGQYTGTLSCPSTGRSGPLTFYEVANGVKRLNGRYTMDWTYGCRWTGRFAGVSSTP